METTKELCRLRVIISSRELRRIQMKTKSTRYNSPCSRSTMKRFRIFLSSIRNKSQLEVSKLERAKVVQFMSKDLLNIQSTHMRWLQQKQMRGTTTDPLALLSWTRLLVGHIPSSLSNSSKSRPTMVEKLKSSLSSISWIWQVLKRLDKQELKEPDSRKVVPLIKVWLCSELALVSWPIRQWERQKLKLYHTETPISLESYRMLWVVTLRPSWFAQSVHQTWTMKNRFLL